MSPSSGPPHQPRFLGTTPCPLFAVAVSDKDRFIAAAHDSGVVAIWQLELAAVAGDMRPVFVGRGHTGSVRALAFEPDGRRDYTCLVSGGADGTIRTWHVGLARSSTLVHHRQTVLSLAFDATGSRLVSGSEDGTIAITAWPDEALERTFPAHARSVLSIAVSPSGDRIASGGFDQCAYLWSMSGTRVARIDDGGRGYVWGVRFLDDDRIVFTKGNAVFEWSERTGSRKLFSNANPVQSLRGLTVRHDRQEIAFGDANRVVTLQLSDPRARARAGHSGEINGVAYRADGRIVSVADDGALLVWGAGDEPALRLRAASDER